MSSTESRLLGFDIRRPFEDSTDVLWSQKRRDLYLLNSGTRWPLSIDNLVWLSVFRYAEPVPAVAALQQLATISADPEYTEDGLWIDLPRMRESYQRAKSQGTQKGVEIGVDLVAPTGLSLDQFRSPLLDRNTSPSKVPQSASLLGFDVADSALVSGLSNCSYKTEEKHNLREGWSEKLNEHGLFRNVDDAIGFKSINDRRVSGHAPFWVFGLYRLN